MKVFLSVFLSFLLIFPNESFTSNLSFKKNSPNILHRKLKGKFWENKKTMAAVLAFPLPFGFFGAHRIYMGTKPVVPVTYIATLGGCFGILPFIDFCVILSKKDLKKFENNHKVFMWNDSEKK